MADTGTKIRRSFRDFPSEIINKCIFYPAEDKKPRWHNPISANDFCNYSGVSVQIPLGYVVVDVDDMPSAMTLLKIVRGENIKCLVLKANRGFHFWFKENPKKLINKKSTDNRLLIGLKKVDFLMSTMDERTGKVSRCTECIKFGGEYRELIYGNGEIDEIPLWLCLTGTPDEKFKTGPKKGEMNEYYQNFMNMVGLNEYRNETILRYHNFLLAKTKKQLEKIGFEDSQIDKGVVFLKRLINKYVFAEPLPDNEIESLCREDFLKAEEIKNSQKEDNTIKVGDMVYKTGGFIVSEEGIYLPSKDSTKLVSYIPMVISALYKEAETGVEYVELKYLGKGNIWKLAPLIPIIKIRKSALITEALTEIGIDNNGNNAGLLVEYLYMFRHANEDTIPIRETLCRAGWIKGEFVPYSDKYLLRTNNPRLKVVHNHGNIEKWVETVKPLTNNIKIRLALASSFASVLLELVGVNSSWIHIWGKSGTGKTVLSRVCASVWGNPRHYEMAASSTDNSLEMTAHDFYNLPMVLGDTNTRAYDSKAINRLVMRLCENENRGRLNRLSELKNTLRWFNIFISSGEYSIKTDDLGEGAMNRLLELEARQEEKEFSFLSSKGNEVCSSIYDNYGWAGQQFVEQLPSKEVIKQLYHDKVEELNKVSSSTQKQNNFMAVLLVADKLCSSILRYEQDISCEDACDLLTSKQETSLSERSVDYVKHMIHKNILHFDHSDEGIRTGDCLGKYNLVYDLMGDTEGHIEVFVDKNTVDEWLSKINTNFSAVKKDWSENGFLIKDANGQFTVPTKFHGITKRMIKLNLGIYTSAEKTTEENDKYTEAFKKICYSVSKSELWEDLENLDDFQGLKEIINEFAREVLKNYDPWKLDEDDFMNTDISNF